MGGLHMATRLFLFVAFASMLAVPVWAQEDPYSTIVGVTGRDIDVIFEMEFEDVPEAPVNGPEADASAGSDAVTTAARVVEDVEALCGEAGGCGVEGGGS